MRCYLPSELVMRAKNLSLFSTISVIPYRVILHFE
jgi:hypothetical protein